MSDSWEVPAPRGIPRSAFRRQDMGIVDYTLAKRALLREFRRGLTSRLEICDAHPELLRAAKHLGKESTRPCPVCSKEELRLLAYVYADGTGRDNGRAWRVEDGLSIAAAHPGAACYVVEVCLECSWNHLTEAFVTRTAG